MQRQRGRSAARAAEAPKTLHAGEMRIHRAMGVPPEVSASVPQWADTELDVGKARFFAAMPFVVFASTDAAGSPWVSVVTCVDASEPLLEATAANAMSLRARTSANDPVVGCLRAATSATPWAAVAIDFSERQRVLVEGLIRRSRVTLAADQAVLEAELTVQTTTGNCPKYIAVKDVRVTASLAPASASAAAAAAAAASAAAVGTTHLASLASLDADACKLIADADTFFVATRHVAPDGRVRMHVNHRGGPKGFARVGTRGASIAWPEYSGNRKYTSLGNIESDGVAGVVFVDWTTGDALHVTGTARVLTGDAAAALLPRTKAAVTLNVGACVLLRGAIRVMGGTTLEPSPYNPPVRVLAEEADDNIVYAKSTAPTRTADVIGATAVSDSVATFTLRLRDGATLLCRPGQYVVLDFSGIISSPYAHMNDRRPHTLNDDFVRAYTISSATPRARAAAGGVASSAPALSENDGFAPCDTFTVTVKHKRNGSVTPLLHAWASATARPRLSLPVLGVAGSFSIFDPSRPGSHLVPDAAPGTDVLFVAAGTGVTPFLSMLDALDRRRLGAVLPAPRVHVLLSTHTSDAGLADAVAASDVVVSLVHFVTDAAPHQADVGPEGRRRTRLRRMTAADIADVVATCDNGKCSSAWLCGPTAFMAFARASLSAAGVSTIHEESYLF